MEWHLGMTQEVSLSPQKSVSRCKGEAPLTAHQPNLEEKTRLPRTLT